MAPQIRFSFVDPAGKPHSLVLLPASQGSVRGAVLDGKLVALSAHGRRADYRSGDLAIGLQAGWFGAKWTLTCGERPFPGQSSSVRLADSILATLVLGPPNELTDELTTSVSLLRITGRGPDGKPLPAEARDATEFHDMLGDLTPLSFVAPTLLGINVVVYLLMLASGVQTTEDMLRWGADYAPRVKDGQVWRMVTSTFLHFGFLHLFLNMLLFLSAALIVERIVGNAGFAILYLVSGVTGSLASLHVHPGLVGAGASGAVFGVLGGLLGLMMRYHVYVHLKDILKVALLVVLLLTDNVIENRDRPAALGRIDLAAHVGGFLGGLACGVLMCQRMGPAVRAGRVVRNSIAAGGGLAVAIAGALLVPRVDDVLAEARVFIAADTQLQTETLSLVKRPERPNALYEIDEALQRKIIPQWSAACERLAGLSRIPDVYRELVNALRDYGRLRGESWTLLAEAVHWNDVTRLKKFLEKSNSAEGRMMDYLLSNLETRPRRK